MFCLRKINRLTICHCHILIAFLVTNCQGKSISNAEDDLNEISPVTTRIISRDDWSAQPVDKIMIELRLPVQKVIITHTKYHIESRHFDDIAYNWLVGGDGAVYEGRGWTKLGAHTRGQNSLAVGIAFIGTFTESEPPQQQLDAARFIIEKGVSVGAIDKNYHLYGHRQFFDTISPGDKLFEILKTWDHFDNLESN